MEEGPRKLPAIPEYWQVDFDTVVKNSEALVMQLRDTEEFFKKMQSESLADEQKFERILRAYDANDPNQKEMMDRKIKKHEKYVEELQRSMAGLEEFIKDIKERHQEQLKIFQDLKIRYYEEEIGLDSGSESVH